MCADNYQALKSASQSGNLRVVKLLSKKTDSNVWYDYSLALASYCGYLKITKILLEKGVDVHAENNPALLVASQNGHLKVVKLLIENEDNSHVKNDRVVVVQVKTAMCKLLDFIYEMKIMDILKLIVL